MDNALPIRFQEFVNEAEYKEKVERLLALSKQKGATAAEVGLIASRGLSVTSRLSQTETLEFTRDKSIGVTIYIGNKKGTASTTEMTDESIESTVDAAINLAKLTESDPFSGLADKEEMARNVPDLKLYHPWDISVEQAIELTKTCEAAALNSDKRIVNSDGATLSTGQNFHIYANSNGFLGAYPTTRHTLSCVVIAKDKQGMERDFDYTQSRESHCLKSPEAVGLETAKRTLKRLEARKLTTRKAPILFDAPLASTLFSHFLAAISGGRLFRETSFLLDSLNKAIFPEFVQLYERPRVEKALSSAPFDNDGVATFDKDFVKDGRVCNYVLGSYSARKLKMKTTANAGGVHNVFVEPTTIEPLLKQLNTGLLVTELMGQGINLVTGDYSRGASGFWVENGEIQYPVHEITVAGNLNDIFKGIVGIGSDIDKRKSIQTGSLLINEMMIAGS